MNNSKISASHLKLSAITLISAMALTACDDKSEAEIPLADVPRNIVNIVQNTLPGISLTEAEKETKDGKLVYELEGKLINGKEYEMKIAEDGTIIKIELDD